MAGKNKSVMTSNNVTKKTFDHTKGEIRIAITVRTDIKQELKDSREILETIIKEIDEELSNK